MNTDRPYRYDKIQNSVHQTLFWLTLFYLILGQYDYETDKLVDIIILITRSSYTLAS